MVNDDGRKKCLLDEDKICDDCGECDRCDLDPNKICDNCCKCLAIEDADKEFRTVTLGGERPNRSGSKPSSKPVDGSALHNAVNEAVERSGLLIDEPYELTPELVAYWESKLLEYGEAPADDGFGEIEVAERIPVKGERKLGQRRAAHLDRNKHHD